MNPHFVVDPLGAKWRLCSRYPNGGKKVALITGAGMAGIRIATEDGRVLVSRGSNQSLNLLRSFTNGWIVYSLAGPKELARATKPQLWTAWKRCSGGTYFKLKLQDGPSIIPMRQRYDGLTDEEAITGLLTLLYALEEYGVMPSSLGTMSFHLWRSTLTSKVVMSGPPDARQALYGGRQECLYPGEYRDADYYDLSAAYPVNMARETFPLRLIRDRIPSIAAPVGIAYARVNVPERVGWHPIPVRLNPSKPWYVYGHGSAEGWWTLRELRLAKEDGTDIVILDSWSGRHHFEQDLFRDWWTIAQELRALPGFAGQLAKVLTSQLWGKFSLRPVGTSSHTWTDDFALEEKTLTLSKVPKSMPQNGSSYIAADITARVREVLWNEGLSNSSAVYCDTDAVIIDGGSSPGSGWRSKLPKRTGIVDVRGPQMLRWECRECLLGLHSPWHYIVAGAKNRDTQEHLFERRNRRLAMNPTWGLTFPSGDIHELKRELEKGNNAIKRASSRNRLESVVRERRESS